MRALKIGCGSIVGIFFLIFVFIIVASAVHLGAPKKAAKNTTTGKSAPPSREAEARAWIRHHGRDSLSVKINVGLVQLQIGNGIRNPTIANLDKVAELAQEAHDNIDNIRADFALDASDPGELGNAELNAFSGANGLKNSMGALVAWTGDQTPATLASFSTQYQSARAEWNSGVRGIWRIAHRKHPPTV